MSAIRQALALAALLGAGLARAAAPAAPVVVRSDDIDRFYRVYDAAHGRPTAEALQAGYLDPGSPGLHQYLAARIKSAASLQHSIDVRPADYAGARRCLAPLADTKSRLPAVFARFVDAYPAARIAPVTLVIGRDDTGGNTTPDGVIIGVETMCRSNWLDDDVATRFVHIIAHEMAHVQQPAAAQDDVPGATLLFQSLLEGGADFMAELTSGATANPQLQRWTRGHECAIEQAFEKDALGTDISHWLYNGVGTPDKPGDLGYWVGYRIVKTYYAQARDKKAAVDTLLHIDNASAPQFLKDSGWKPQTGC
ncbi:MAG TPA: DUF2268 domain-containing putative Zn-dependent protease [Burkholderiaceae bacterium]|jgi:hypothetical protein|nr:DUF2268 domain-containing putative Zn-dependent protease [Burkholderiaceae bacterium]